MELVPIARAGSSARVSQASPRGPPGPARTSTNVWRAPSFAPSGATTPRDHTGEGLTSFYDQYKCFYSAVYCVTNIKIGVKNFVTYQLMSYE